MMVEELSELVIAHMGFCGMDSESYLLDLHDPTCLCFILHEDHEYMLASMISVMMILPKPIWTCPTKP